MYYTLHCFHKVLYGTAFGVTCLDPFLLKYNQGHNDSSTAYALQGSLSLMALTVLQ